MTMMTLLTQSDLAQADERIQSGAKTVLTATTQEAITRS